MGEGSTASKGGSQDELIIWPGITSTTKILELALAQGKLGGANVLFKIGLKWGRDISQISRYSYEQEVLLPGPSAFKVTKIEEQSELTVISLE